MRPKGRQNAINAAPQNCCAVKPPRKSALGTIDGSPVETNPLLPKREAPSSPSATSNPLQMAVESRRRRGCPARAGPWKVVVRSVLCMGGRCLVDLGLDLGLGWIRVVWQRICRGEAFAVR